MNAAGKYGAAQYASGDGEVPGSKGSGNGDGDGSLDAMRGGEMKWCAITAGANDYGDIGGSRSCWKMRRIWAELRMTDNDCLCLVAPRAN